MRTIIAAGLVLAAPSLALAEGAATEGMPVETGAVGQEVFIETRQDYHLLASELVGVPVHAAGAAAGQGMQQTGPEAGDTASAATVDEAQPVGAIADVLLDRSGALAGIVVAIEGGAGGGDAREVAVLIELVDLVADPDDPETTHVALRLNSADLQNAPAFQP